MSSMTTLQDLFVHQLRDLYSAEKQLVKALPTMVRRSTSEALQQAFTAHLEVTREQVTRLDQIFEQLGVSSRGPKCKAMEGLIVEASELMDEDIEPSVLDAGLVAAAQRVEHYEIAAYGTVVAYAGLLGEEDAMSLLQTTLDEEKDADASLTTLAEDGINARAMQGVELSDAEDE